MGAGKLRARILQQRADGGKARGRGEKSAFLRVEIPRYRPSFESCYGSGKAPSANSSTARGKAARHAGGAKKRSPASRNSSILSELRKLLWERQSPRARILQQRAGRRQGARARRKISAPASRNPSILSAFRKLLWERQSPSSVNYSTARRKAARLAGAAKNPRRNCGCALSGDARRPGSRRRFCSAHRASALFGTRREC